MLQKIAAICTVISFVFGIYTTLADNPEWQRYSLFGFAFLCFIVWLVDRKHKLRITGKVMTLRRTQPLPYPYRRVEVEVFYPEPFECTPNLTIRFQEMKHLGRYGIDEPSEPEYKITEQRSDGFKLEVLSFTEGYYKPIIEWQAKGQLKE